MSDVAIVGIGAVFPGAADAAAFWHNIRSGIDAITEVPKDRWDPDVYYRPGETGDDRFYCRRGGFVDELADFDPAQFGIMPTAVPGTEPDQLLLLRAAAEAIADCGTPPGHERTGVIIGRGGYLTPGLARLSQRVHTAHQLTEVLRDLVPGLTEDDLAKVRAAFRERLGPRGESSIGLVPNFAASRLANRFNLRGPAYTVDAACASSLVAVDQAVSELTSGRCDAVLAGGVNICHDPTLWSTFIQLRALSAAQQIRPFDRHADGTLLSEGAGVVLLKRLRDALDAGDRVYAVIRGVGVSSDGRATSMMNPLGNGQELAIRRAWATAGLDPGAKGPLGLLEAHGTATPIGDRVELETLQRVFGGPSGQPVGIGSVKSMIGHAMSAAGIAGLIKAALAVHHGVLPPTLHISEPQPALALSRFEPVMQVREWPDDVVRRAAVSAFGFGGINTHLILEAPPASARGAAAPASAPPAAAASAAPLGSVVPGTSREAVLRLAAGSPTEMAGLLDAPDPELLGRVGREPAAGPCRLAIVAPDQRKVALARKIVARGTPWRGRSDIWFTPHPLLSGSGQVAFLFPGFEPEFMPRLEGIAETFGLAAPQLRDGQAGADPRAGVVEHALDIVEVSRLFSAALGEISITPGVVAGHSLGEWTAMIVAGVYPEIDAFMASMRPGMAEVPDVVYAALGMPADRAAQFAGTFGEVVVTHDNCPHQSVVCGPSPLVAALVERARAEGILAQGLPFRTGFHSPMYAPYLTAARETLWGLEVRPASIPVWSATSLSPFPRDPDQVRELVLRHLVEPVRFRELITRLHDAGVRAFVQVGPGSLTGFAEDTLAGRDYLTVSTTVAHRDGLAQLRRVAAALWADGLSPRFSRLATAPAAASGVRLRLGAPLVRLTGMTLPATPLPGGPVRGDSVPGGPVPGASVPGDSVHADSVLAGSVLAGSVPAGSVPAGSVPAITPTGQTAGGNPGLPDGSPVLAELNALMVEIGTAAGTVAQAAARPPGAQPAVQAAATPAATAATPREIVTVTEFSLRTMPDVADHCIFPQAEGWPDDSDRFPVVPMTMLLDILADAARDLVPGRVVVGFEQLTAARWLTVAPPTTARIHAAADGENRVRVRIEGYASGSVLLADTYPAAPTQPPEPLHGERPAPVTAREMYADNWMFHGPRFAGVTDIEAVADDGVRGVVLSMPARGALLDCAGQLICHWMQVSFTSDQTALPTGMRAVQLYGPQPPVGERLTAVAWIREVTAIEMRADAELRTSDSRVWCRIQGLTTRRFATDDAIWAVTRKPDRNTLARQCPGGWYVVWERWADTASREVTMRRYLNAAERARYEELNPLQQRQWLLGRIAAKDAVRRWLWERGAGPMYPAEITIEDADGQVRARGPFRAPAVSIANGPLGGPGRTCAVAIADDEPVSFTVELGDDGTVLVAQPGREPRPIDTAAPATALTARRRS